MKQHLIFLLFYFPVLAVGNTSDEVIIRQQAERQLKQFQAERKARQKRRGSTTSPPFSKKLDDSWEQLKQDLEASEEYKQARDKALEAYRDYLSSGEQDNQFLIKAEKNMRNIANTVLFPEYRSLEEAYENLLIAEEALEKAPESEKLQEEYKKANDKAVNLELQLALEPRTRTTHVSIGGVYYNRFDREWREAKQDAQFLFNKIKELKSKPRIVRQGSVKMGIQTHPMGMGRTPKKACYGLFKK